MTVDNPYIRAYRILQSGNAEMMDTLLLPLPVSERTSAALLCLRTGIEEIPGLDPHELKQRHDPEMTEKLCIDYFIRRRCFPDEGFVHFSKGLNDMTLSYLLSLCYPDDASFSFSFGEIAAENYRKLRDHHQGSSESIHHRADQFRRTFIEDAGSHFLEVIGAVFSAFIREDVLPELPESPLGTVHDLYALFADDPAIDRFYRKCGLKQIFKNRYTSFYEMLCANMYALDLPDDLLWRQIYSYKNALGK